MAQVKYIGELAVVALKARDLPNREIVGKQDPFCVFRLGEEAKKTKTDYRGGQHPVWDDQVNIMVPEGKVKMRVQLFDEDAKREDLISETDLDITTVMKDGEQDGWFPLSYKGRKAGEIYLELTFYAARPPPRRQPTRYRGGMRPQSYQGSYQGGTPPPPVPTSNYPPQTSTGRPLPPAPLASTSTPSRYNVGPAPYIPPQPVQPVQHTATPHMPSTLTPTPSTSAGYPPSNRPPPQQQHYNHPPQQQQHHQPQGGASYYPPPASSAATPAPGSAQPLLSAPFRPGHSPQNSASSNHPGYPPQNGAPSSQGYPPHPYPSSAHYGNFSTPVMASYPPPSSTAPGNGMNFPEPQRNSGYPPPPPPGSSGFGTPQAYSPYPSAGYPPSGGYPPHNPSGYPPQQQQQQQPHYNPQGYPPHH